MLVRRIDAVTLLRADAAEQTAEGFRLYDALFARSGTQRYDDGRGGTIIEYRPDAEVFHPASLASYELRPLTDLHPPGNVTASTARMLARGAVSTGVRAQDGRHVAGRLAVWDEDLIAKFDAAPGGMQLSAGYSLDLDPTPGTTPDGERYDAIQRAIRINHVAAVPLGRAGTARVLTDAADLVGAWDMGFAKRLDDVAPHRSQRVVFDLGRWARQDGADLRTQTIHPAKEIQTMKIQTNVDGQPVEIEIADGASPQEIADATVKALADAFVPFKKKGEEEEEEEAEDMKMAKAKDKKKADHADAIADVQRRADERIAAAERRADALSVARAVIGLDYDGPADEHAIQLDVIGHVLGQDERAAVESVAKQDRAGAAAYAFRKAVKAHRDAPTKASTLLETIRASQAKRDGAPVEDPYAKARRDAAERLANPTPQKVS